MAEEKTSFGSMQASAVVGFLEGRLSPGSENFREGSRVILRVIYVQLFVMVVLAGFVANYVSDGYIDDDYYSITTEGLKGASNIKTPMTSLDTPGYGNQGILDWTTVAVAQVLTFGFNNVDQRLAASRSLFTDIGWVSFVKAFSRKRIVESIQAAQQIVTAIPRGLPTIRSEGFVDGRYAWTIALPVVLTARAGKRTGSARLTVVVTVVKVPTEIDPKGLGIEKWDEE